MLVHLHVKNLALIEESEVEFGPGLNILTGETGAGKSILLGSIQLILGGKTSRSMIRENASYARVELLFQVENTKARESLAALDIYPEDGQVLMSRKIMDGRSINKMSISRFFTETASWLFWMYTEKNRSFLPGRRSGKHIRSIGTVWIS